MRSSERRRTGTRFRACLATLLAISWPVASQVAAQEQPASSAALGEARLTAMTPLEQRQFGQRLAAWNALPRAEREARRARFLAWMQLPPDERAQLRALAVQIAAFPPERRQGLRAQFESLEEVQRRGWRLGPSLGRDYAALFPLLAYVPEAQQAPLLARLRVLDAAQRADLAVLVQRTPPQERSALRMELLAVPPATLAAWLKRRLDQ